MSDKLTRLISNFVVIRTDGWVQPQTHLNDRGTRSGTGEHACAGLPDRPHGDGVPVDSQNVSENTGGEKPLHDPPTMLLKTTTTPDIPTA